MAEPERSARRPLDPVALARTQRRLLQAPHAPWLHGEVARRMAERLPLVRLQPAAVLDWGGFLGDSHALLARAYPGARLCTVEPDPARRDATAAALAPAWWSPRRWSAGAPQVLTEDQVAAGAGQLLWSNMGLHFAPDPAEVMARWHRALAVDGFLMFSTLGPGSFSALRALYASQGWPPPLAPLVDMHDLGDMLVHAGFADPVMDQELVTLTWPTAAALLDELRTLGANLSEQRHAGLRTPRWRRRLGDLLEARADGAGRVAMGVEIVFGHAFRPPPRPLLAAETTLPLDDLRAMVRSGRRRP